LEGSGHWNLTKEAGAGPALLGTCHQGRGRGLCHPWMARVVNLTLAGGSRRRLVVSFGGGCDKITSWTRRGRETKGGDKKITSWTHRGRKIRGGDTKITSLTLLCLSKEEKLSQHCRLLRARVCSGSCKMER